MERIRIIPLALAATLLLAACTAPHPDPAEPVPEGSVLPTSAPSDDPAPVAESPFAPCDDASTVALHALYPGDSQAEPTGDYYPDVLPLPSCVFEDADFAEATAFFLPATETDFETLEAAIAAEQGVGTPSDGQVLTTAGEARDGQPILGILLVPASYGVTLDYIAIRFEFP